MISVCMATYNGDRFLREQVDSILAQLSSDDELVVSDDGSTDQTLSILEGYGDKRIKVYHNTERHGVNGNFENAIRHAKGELIFLSDQDDVWLPEKVKVCIDALQSCDCVVHDAIVVDSALKITLPSFFEERKSGNGFWKNIYKNTYLGCCMAFRREILKVALPIPKSKYFFHDNWIGAIADARFKLLFISFKGIYFRRHDFNTSCTVKKSKYSLFRQFCNRAEQIILTIPRLF